jgi:hypothetical protein
MGKESVCIILSKSFTSNKIKLEIEKKLRLLAYIHNINYKKKINDSNSMEIFEKKQAEESNDLNSINDLNPKNDLNYNELYYFEINGTLFSLNERKNKIKLFLENVTKYFNEKNYKEEFEYIIINNKSIYL